jgi:hypothetical protein
MDVALPDEFDIDLRVYPPRTPKDGLDACGGPKNTEPGSSCQFSCMVTCGGTCECPTNGCPTPQVISSRCQFG